MPDNNYVPGGFGAPPANTGSTGGGFSYINPNANSMDTPEGLLSLAQSQGGAIAQTANELVHPNTSILSTIGSGFKSAFKGFVDTISLPSEAVAGMLSSKYSVQEAVAQHLRPSDVIFGAANPDDTTMQKIGGFLVRTAADVMLDPLTYITFGAGQGFLGLRATTELTLGERAAATMGKEYLATNAVSKEGQNLYKALSHAIDNQADGTAMAKLIQSGNETEQLAGQELEAVLAKTINSPLDQDFAKEAMSNLLENHPGLSETLLDKGGIKVFGNTILEGQRIRSAIKMIPGISVVDHITAPVRGWVSALFNPNMVKEGGSWIRLPGEAVDIEQKARDLATAMSDTRVSQFNNIVQANKMTTQEASFLLASIEAGKIPVDERLAGMFHQLQGLDENELKYLRDSGFAVSKLDNHWSHMLTKGKVSPSPFKMPPSAKLGAAMHRKIEGTVFNTTAKKLPAGLEDLAKDAKQFDHPQQFEDTVMEASNAGKAAMTDEEVKTAAQYDKDIANAKESFGDLKTFHMFATGKDMSGLHAWEEALTKGDIPRVEAIAKELKADGFENFDDNVVTSGVLRALDNVRASGARQYMLAMAARFGKSEEEAGTGWRQVSSSGMREAGKETSRVIGVGEDGAPITLDAEHLLNGVKDPKGAALYYHPAIAKRMEQFVGATINDDATSDFLKHFDSVQNLWKASVTSIFPAFHGRNAISNVLNNFLDLGYHSINPATHTKAAQLVNWNRQASNLRLAAAKVGPEGEAAKNALSELMTKTVFKDTSGQEWSYGELERVIRDHNVAFTSRILNAADVAGGQVSLTKALFEPTDTLTRVKNAAQNINPLSKENIALKTGSAIGQKIEEQARLVNFLSNLHNTGDVNLAAKRTKQFLFDYGSLTNFEKTFMKRLIPFYTWTRKNLELQANTLMTAPGRVAGELQGLQNLSDVLSGGQLTPEQEAALPDWIKTGIELPTSIKGNNVTMLSSLGTPLEQPFQYMQPNQFLGSISPLIRVPLEQMTGYSLFQGKMLSDVTNASAFKHAPQAIKNLIGYTSFTGHRSDGTSFDMQVALNPSMMNLILNLPPTSRVFSAMKQMDAVDVSGQDKIMQQLIGSRPYSFDVEQEAAKRVKAQKQALEDLLTKAGVLGKYQTVFKPKPTL